MALSITFMIPPISGHDYGPIAETTYGTIGDDTLFNVSLDQEVGSVTTFSFSTIATTIFAYHNGSGADIPIVNILKPGKTLVKFKENGAEVFYGRIYSVGKGVDGADVLRVICEDLSGYLRESFIWYSKEYDDDENSQFRAMAGDSVSELLNAIKDNHNNYMAMAYELNAHSTYWTGNVSCGIREYTGISSETLNSDLSLDGMSTMEALNAIFDDLGYEWDILNPSAKCIVVRAAPRIVVSGGGTIATGKTLRSASRTENVRDMFSAIMPLGGYGYNERRLSLSNQDFPYSLNGGYPQYTIDTLKIPSDPTKETTDGERQVLYAVNTTLYNKYGLRIKTVIYDDIAVDTNDDEEIAAARQVLVDLAKIDAEELNQSIVEWNVDAVDLYNVGIGPQYILYALYNINDTINNISVSNSRLIKIHKNYDRPADSNFSFELPTEV